MVRSLRFALLLPALVTSGCRTPTSVELKLFTNVSCADKPSTSITVNRSSTATQEPATITTSCQPDGTIGSIVILPASSKDETLLVRVVTSLKDPVETACVAPSYGPGCIVSRRRLSFVAHEELQLPVVQEVDCAGLVCGESQTCRKGGCVSAQVDVDRCASSPQDCGQELIPDIPLGRSGRAGMGGAGAGGAGMGGAGAGGAGMGGAGTGGAGMGGAGTGGAGMGGAGTGGAGMGGMGPVTPPVGPRQIRPMSLSTVTSQTPTLRWALAPDTDGALVELCQEPTCAKPLLSLPVQGDTVKVPQALAPGRVFWRLTSRMGNVIGEGKSPVWSFTVGHLSAPLDVSWGTTPDFDRDGYADVLIGAKGMSATGTVQVFPGRAGGPQLPPALTLQVVGDAGFGKAIGVVDLNGDGYADAFATTESSQSTFVFLGSPQGLVASPAFTLPGQPGANAGKSASGAGDINGDGYGDFIVSGHNGNGNAGLVSVYYGSPTGTPMLQVVPGAVPGGQLGYNVAGVGDVNGDGFSDIAACAPNTNSTFVFLGSAAGIVASPTEIPALGGSKDGCTVAAAGDVNGDGYADLLTGGFSLASPSIGIFFGGVMGISTSPAGLFAASGGSDAEDRGFGLGDVDGDGYGDFSIVHFGADNSGQVVLYRGGGPQGYNLDPLALAQGGKNDYAGWSVAAAGDVDGDGIADAVLGTRGVNGGAGLAQVFLGKPALSSSNLLQPSLTVQGSAGGDVVGWSVASLELSGRGRPGRHGPLLWPAVRLQ